MTLNPPFSIDPAHESSEDDVWEGYLIPKGSTIFVNTWYGFLEFGGWVVHRLPGKVLTS